MDYMHKVQIEHCVSSLAHSMFVFQNHYHLNLYILQGLYIIQELVPYYYYCFHINLMFDLYQKIAYQVHQNYLIEI